MRPSSFTLMLTLILTAFSLHPTLAGAANKDAVVDSRGNVVRAILSGTCARTKWSNGLDQCSGEARPTSRIVGNERAYIVFFDFNASSLSSFAQTVVNNLVKGTKNATAAIYELTGHADRSGSNAYNLQLSQKRALAVQSALRSLGVPKRNIRLNWKGESLPLVPTADGIKEPQNRRTEIKVKTSGR